MHRVVACWMMSQWNIRPSCCFAYDFDAPNVSSRSRRRIWNRNIIALSSNYIYHLWPFTRFRSALRIFWWRLAVRALQHWIIIFCSKITRWTVKRTEISWCSYVVQITLTLLARIPIAQSPWALLIRIECIRERPSIQKVLTASTLSGVVTASVTFNWIIRALLWTFLQW